MVGVYTRCKTALKLSTCDISTSGNLVDMEVETLGVGFEPHTEPE